MTNGPSELDGPFLFVTNMGRPSAEGRSIGAGGHIILKPETMQTADCDFTGI